MTIQELWEKQRREHFGYCNIDKYHAMGFKGKGFNFLNLEISDHGLKVCKVYSEVCPEAKIFEGSLNGTTNGTRITKFDITVNNVRQDFETFVVNNNIKVINSSIAGGVKVVQDFMKEFILDKHGVILTNSAGNEGEEYITGAYSDVGIVVGAVNYNGGNPILTSYSNEGAEIDFVSFPHLFTGTSFSAPFVAGQITLLLNRFGDFNQSQGIEVLKLCSKDLGEPGFEYKYGYGIPVLPIDDETINKVKEIIKGGTPTMPEVIEQPIFSDVPAEHIHKAGIEYCFNNGIMLGDGQGHFRPDDKVSRAELATVIERLFNK